MKNSNTGNQSQLYVFLCVSQITSLTMCHLLLMWHFLSSAELNPYKPFKLSKWLILLMCCRVPLFSGIVAFIYRPVTALQWGLLYSGNAQSCWPGYACNWIYFADLFQFTYWNWLACIVRANVASDFWLKYIFVPSEKNSLIPIQALEWCMTFTKRYTSLQSFTFSSLRLEVWII